MTAHRAYVGIGANLGDRIATVEGAIAALGGAGAVVARSSLFQTQPWGVRDQPAFVNAVAVVETRLTPRALLERLQTIERAMGRVPGERWGPRVVDLDLLLYDDLRVDEDGLQVPHPRLRERAFVLVPLAEVDARFEPLRDALDSSELAGVVAVERELVTTMPEERSLDAAERVRALAQFLAETDAVRVRIAREGDEIEVAGIPANRRERAAAEPATAGATAARVDSVKADLVGIFHLSRPAPIVDDLVEPDRELGYIEALGIRTPVHSMGAGRLVSMPVADGTPVEYGQPLFLIARSG
ncbi:MAG TPA: 2-amino-4-hydroxy-6-hydroxymethyldihydropteridine diphosphokinase [Candidatus Binatia bacterium]|nr:2-amino-4-hydroxy-6-hydroxymethyldihydropteridine diphosphokinase [Candidatus Binatia bacterium]